MREWFENLSFEDKRNELNKETITLVLFVNKIVADENKEYFNYKHNDNNIMSEEDFLTEEFLQVIEAKQKLINIFK